MFSGFSPHSESSARLCRYHLQHRSTCCGLLALSWVGFYAAMLPLICTCSQDVGLKCTSELIPLARRQMLTSIFYRVLDALVHNSSIDPFFLPSNAQWRCRCCDSGFSVFAPWGPDHGCRIHLSRSWYPCGYLHSQRPY